MDIKTYLQQKTVLTWSPDVNMFTALTQRSDQCTQPVNQQYDLKDTNA